MDEATYNRALVHVHVDIVLSPLSYHVITPLSCMPMCCHYTLPGQDVAGLGARMGIHVRAFISLTPLNVSRVHRSSQGIAQKQGVLKDTYPMVIN